MRQRYVYFITLLLMSVFVLLAGEGQVARAAILITPSNNNNWRIWTEGTSPVHAFTAGPKQAPLGRGSFGVDVTSSNSKLTLGPDNYDGVALSTIQSLSFNFFVDPSTTTPYGFYLNLYVDRDGDGSFDTRLSASSGTSTKNTWFGWHPGDMSYIWRDHHHGTHNPIALADFIANNPNARLINAGGDPAILLNIGNLGSQYVGFKGNLDKVVIAFSGLGTTIYDFEPEGVQRAASDSSSSVPGIPNDGRVNYPDYSGPIAVYEQDYGIHVYGIAPDSQGYLVLAVNAAEIEAIPEQPDDHTLIKEGYDGVRLYRLSTGQFQVNSGPYGDGREYVVIWGPNTPGRVEIHIFDIYTGETISHHVYN